MTAQLPLSWPAPAHFRFEQFETGSSADTVSLLMRCAEGQCGAPVLLLGPAASGKTHLLVAAGASAREVGSNAGYLALSRWSDFDGDALMALAAKKLLAVDEIEAIAGRRDAEVAVFDLFNRCLDANTQLLLASRESPQSLSLTLPDLRSRLAAATLAPLQPLDEEGRRRFLQSRARTRGFDIDDAVVDYVFRYYRRDLPALIALIDRLDQETLAKQRRVTIPLVRSVLDDPGG